MSKLSIINKIKKIIRTNTSHSFDTTTKYVPYSIFPNKQIQEWANEGLYKTKSKK